MKGTEAEACEASLKACTPKVTRLKVIIPPGEIIDLRNIALKFRLQDDCQTLMIEAAPKRRSDIARDLHSPKYRQRVIQDKKKKPKGKSLEEMLDEANEERKK